MHDEVDESVKFHLRECQWLFRTQITPLCSGCELFEAAYITVNGAYRTSTLATEDTAHKLRVPVVRELCHAFYGA